MFPANLNTTTTLTTALIGKLVLLQGVISKPELNGQLGIALSFDDDKGRYAVALVGGTSVALKPANLVDWASSVADYLPAPGTADKIKEASPAETLAFMREGAILSTSGGVARACLERLLKLPIRTTGRELTSGGQIEMMVQSIGVHINGDRGDLFMLLFTISNTVVAGDDMSRGNLANEMKDRAVRAGIFPAVAAVLSTHTTSDIQCNAMSIFSAVASGGGFPETEVRRAAAGPFLGEIAAVMKLQVHRSVVQHFGMQAIGAICATNDQTEEAPAARADAAIATNVHVAIIEAMLRHGHIAGENGLCTHELKSTAIGPGKDGTGEAITISLPGSVLLSGCQALQLLIHGGETSYEARIKALNDAGALKAIAAAVRTNPIFSDFEKWAVGPPRDLASMQIVQPLILKLIGPDGNMYELMDEEDRMTLVGDSDEPGFILQEFRANLEKEGDLEAALNALGGLGPHPAPGPPFYNPDDPN